MTNLEKKRINTILSWISLIKNTEHKNRDVNDLIEHNACATYNNNPKYDGRDSIMKYIKESMPIPGWISDPVINGETINVEFTLYKILTFKATFEFIEEGTTVKKIHIHKKGFFGSY